MTQHKYLRDIVAQCEDRRLIGLLDSIEEHLASEFEEPKIAVEPAKNILFAAVRPDEKGFTFLYDQGSDSVHPDVIFHELMHISLFIEGWPILKPGPGACTLLEDYGELAKNLVFDVFMNGFSHPTIHQREKQCGFCLIQRELWNNKLIPKALKNIPTMWDRSWDSYVKEYKATPLRALAVLPAMLSPASRDNRKLLRETLEKYLPRLARLQVQAIYRVFAEPKIPFPQSIPVALAELESKLRLPAKLLELRYLSRTDANFYARCLKSGLDL